MRRLKLGISCYPTFGGSGVIAAEIGQSMARLGHEVHFIASDVPFRLTPCTENVFFHEVEGLKYPLFPDSLYTLSLASKIVEVTNNYGLDILHAHYAVPHAASAYLARQILGKKAPKIVTTLHGTDITLVGNDSSYLPVTRFAIEQSDVVTAVSSYLRDASYTNLSIDKSKEIVVIPNFVDTSYFTAHKTRDCSKLLPFLPRQKEKLPCDQRCRVLVHISNFRPVKRVLDTIEILTEVRKTTSAALILIGDGPERSRAENHARSLGVANFVSFLGKVRDVRIILQNGDVFLLPSEEESFGLAALEAMACGMPVVASNIGGIPELVTHEKEGFLAKVGDIKSMSNFALKLLTDNNLFKTLSNEAADKAKKRFSEEKILEQYLKVYNLEKASSPL